MSEEQTSYQPSCLSYVDIKKHWSAIDELIQPGTPINELMRADFSKYVDTRWGQHGVTFDDYYWPCELESCDWQVGRVGRPPRYWKLVKHGACHWLVNYQLELARAIMPQYDWRILTSDKHSTVWNQQGKLWDANFMALNIQPQTAFTNANEQLLGCGEHLELEAPKLKITA
jgi:hypothetical protein